MTLSSKLKSFRTRCFSPFVKDKDKASMKQKLLNPLSSSSPNNDEAIQEDFKPYCIIGIDPNLFGALAVLKYDETGSCSAQVYDTPKFQVLVQKILESRYDAKSMVKLIHTLGVPSGTKAFIATSTPYSRDHDATGAYNEGVGYGLWTGLLFTSHINVISIVPCTWMKHFKIKIWRLEGSRKVALEMFPSLGSQLARRVDYRRSNALLIAAYGQAISVTKYYSFSQI